MRASRFAKLVSVLWQLSRRSLGIAHGVDFYVQGGVQGVIRRSGAAAAAADQPDLDFIAAVGMHVGQHAQVGGQAPAMQASFQEISA